jgi:hypothetical protein
LTTPWADLPEWNARFSQSTAKFLDSLHSYHDYGGTLKDEVVERLRRLADPPGYFPEDSVQAAGELEDALDHFAVLQFRLTSNMALIKMAVDMAVDALKLRILRSVTNIPFPQGKSFPDVALQYPADVRNAIEQSGQEVSDIARMVVAVVIDAFDASTDVVQLRIVFLRKFLDATDPPRSIPGLDDTSYKKITRDAAANETLLAAGEVALDHLRLEWARHVPIATIVASLASLALDVRKEVKELQEKQALWQQILDAPYRRNVGDEARDGARRIRKDDEAIDRLSQSLNATLQKLLELIQVLLDSERGNSP